MPEGNSSSRQDGQAIPKDTFEPPPPVLNPSPPVALQMSSQHVSSRRCSMPDALACSSAACQYQVGFTSKPRRFRPCCTLLSRPETHGTRSKSAPPPIMATSVLQMILAITPATLDEVSLSPSKLKPEVSPDFGGALIDAGGSTTQEDAIDMTVQDGANTPNDLPDLAELARMMRLAKYHQRRRLQAERAFRELQITVSKAARLTTAARHVQRTLADCLRAEDKHSFARLNTGYTDAYGRITKPPAQPYVDHPMVATDESLSSNNGFLDDLSSGSRNEIIQILAKLRYDSHFIADRFNSLTSRELVTLLPDGGTSRSSGSVFAGSSRSSFGNSQPLGYLVNSLLEDISFARFRTPLETLVQLHMPPSHDSQDSALHMDTWAEVCAILIRGKHPGGARLLPSLLDIWTAHSPWHGKDKLRSWLLQVLREGHFLLEPNRASFVARKQGQPHLDAAQRAEVFYAQSVSNLLDVLGDDHGNSAIPDGAIAFCRAVFRMMSSSPENQRDLASFVMTRWLFASFLPDLIVCPEINGILTEHYIPDLARQRIFNEVAIRAQKAVTDVFKNGLFSQDVAPELKSKVMKVVARLDFMKGPIDSTSPRVNAHGFDTFTTVSAPDVLSVINVLFPLRGPVSISSDYNCQLPGSRSSASSVSGLSLFRATDTITNQWAATPYSIPGAENFPTLFTAMTTELPHPEPTLPTVMNELAIHDARIELEKWTAANAPASDRRWSVLITLDHERALEPFQLAEESELLRSHSTTLGLPAHDSRRAETFESCRIALDALLGERTARLSASLSLQTDDLNISPGLLELLLDNCQSQAAECEARFDFSGAHQWSQHSHAVEALFTEHGAATLTDVISEMTYKAQVELGTALTQIERCERQVAQLSPTLSEALDTVLQPIEICAQLRTKIWYSTDVRTTLAYDNLRAVASALRVMGKSSKPSGGQGSNGPILRHATGSRPSSSSGHWKSEAQVLDMLGASSLHGGPNKLSEEQVNQVLTWNNRNAVHLVCVGEERLHKFCMEVYKCVEHFTTIGTIGDAQTRTSLSHLQQSSSSAYAPRTHLGLAPHATLRRRMDSISLQTTLAPSIDSISVASHTLSNSSSREYFDNKSPQLTSKSSATFWSPSLSGAQSPASTTSIGSYAASPYTESSLATAADPVAISSSLRKSFTGLLLSEVGDVLFGQGSETDQAFWCGVGGKLTESHLRAVCAKMGDSSAKSPSNGAAGLRPSIRRIRFDYDKAFESLFRLFAGADDPHAKLEYLSKVQALLPPYMESERRSRRDGPSQGTITPEASTSGTFDAVKAGSELASTGFYRLFANSTLRPPHLFRDMQYIASLVPSSILEDHTQGKAFWNAATAASRIKAEMCNIYIETADSIIALHTNARGHIHSASQAQQKRDDASFPSPSRTPSLENIGQYTMSDAAHLLQIAAKEGSPTAQRELATLYLTHPDLMDRVLAPFARPKEVFREEIEGKGRRDRDPERYDPGTMCVAVHWMVKAAEGGDGPAKAHLRQREDLERLG